MRTNKDQQNQACTYDPSAYVIRIIASESYIGGGGTPLKRYYCGEKTVSRSQWWWLALQFWRFKVLRPNKAHVLEPRNYSPYV